MEERAQVIWLCNSQGSIPAVSSFPYGGDIAREREGGSSAFAFEPRTFPLGRP